MQKFLLGLLLAAVTMAQTQLDLRNQSKNADFSSASATKPARTGTTLPATCSPGEIFFNLSAIPGQNLYLCTASGVWTQLTTTSSGGSGSGGGTPASASSLTDLTVTQKSAALLNIGSSCSIVSPCNIRLGTRTFPITGAGNVTLTDTTVSGVAFIYISTLGAQASISVGNTMGATCDAGCTAVDGITEFPPDSVPLATWSSTDGVWDSNGGLDLRAFLSNKSVIGGIGIVTTEIAGQTIVSADTSVVGVRVAVPSTVTTACQQGNYAADLSFFYQCVAANVWRRASVSTW